MRCTRFLGVVSAACALGLSAGAPQAVLAAPALAVSVSSVQVNRSFDGPFPTNKQNEPSLAQNPTDPNNLIAGSNDEIGEPACTDTTPSSCPFVHGVSVSGFYASQDGGQTWPCQGLIDLSAANEFAFGDPGQAFDSRGNAYYATLAFPLAATADELATGLQADLFVAKSTDKGCSYPTAVKVSGASPAKFDDKPSIAADSNPSSPFRDNVYVAWSKFTMIGPGFGNVQVVVSRSTDGGVTWAVPVSLSAAHNNNSVGGRQGTAVKVAPNGTVYVAWLDTVNKQQVELISASSDGGVHFSKPVIAAVVTDDGVNPAPGSSFRQDARTFPSLAIAPDGTLYLAWVDRTGDGPGLTGHAVVKVVRSTTGGSTWSLPVTAGDVAGRSAFFASISVDPVGKVDIVFLALDDVPQGTAPGAGVVAYDAYFTQSINAGASFSSPVKITAVSSDPDGSSTNSLRAQFLGDYITTVADSRGGRAFSVWTDSRNATSCAAVDDFRAGIAPKPDVITDCPPTFGNTDIFEGTISY